MKTPHPPNSVEANGSNVCLDTCRCQASSPAEQNESAKPGQRPAKSSLLHTLASVLFGFGIAVFPKCPLCWALDKYKNLLRREYESYLEIRAQYYQQEQRWPHSPFWQRRFDWLTLNPAAQLVSTASPTPRSDQTRYRLSRQEEEAMLQLCSQPKSAREIVEACKLLPFGPKKDRNIILGLQFLLQEKLLTMVD